MARPRSPYVIFHMRKVIKIVDGHKAAREFIKKDLDGNGAYKRLPSTIAAEEFAAWWNYALDQRESAKR